MRTRYDNYCIKIILVLFVLLGTHIGLFAQERINGTIRGKNGNPLSDATIISDGKLIETSDENGFFNVDGCKTITVEHAGYKSQTLTLGKKKKIEVILEPVEYNADIQLAFETLSYELYTGAQSSTVSKELTNIPTQTLGNNLAGKIAGLTVMQSSGEPGSDAPDLYIRGKSTYNNSDILVLVDGFEGDYNQLLPEEIESVTILKDAAALAIYGIRGANGVMLVKTKRGVKRDKIDIRLNLRGGISSPIKLPDFVDSYTYASLYNEAVSNDNNRIWTPKYTDDELKAYKDGTDPYFYPNVDWYKETLVNNTPYTDTNLSFRGGNNNVRYYLILGYMNSQKFYIKNPDKSFDQLHNLGKTDKYNARANVDVNINKVFSLSANIGAVILSRTYPNSGNFWNTLATIPSNAFPIKNEDGTWAATPVYTNNPLGTLVMTGKRKTNERTLQADVMFRQDLGGILPGLKLSEGISFSSWSLSNYDISRDYQRWYVSKKNGKAGNPTLVAGTEGEFSINQGTRSQWTRQSYQGFVEYETSINEMHRIHTMLGAMYSRYEVDGNNVAYLNAGSFGRLGYGYNNRYLAEFGFSYNGSENLSKGHKFGFFPSLSFAWVLSNEKFLENNNFINFLKMRVSGGILGSADLGSTRFGYQTYYVNSQYSYQLGSSGISSVTGIKEGRLGNPDITYEKNYKYNLGFDFALFNKLNGKLDIFTEKRKGILVVQAPQVPSVVGMTLPYENLGEVSNKGFELELSYNEKINDFRFEIAGNIAYAKNKIDYQAEVFRKNNFSKRTGHAVNDLFGLEAVGFFQSEEEINAPDTPIQTFGRVQPGDIRYKDQDQNGIIDENDVLHLGHSNLPELNYSIKLSFAYKGFDFNAFLFGQAMRSVMLTNNQYAFAFYNNGQVPTTALGRWAYYPERGIDTRNTASYPRLSTSDNKNNYRYSSFWMRDASFLRLRNVEFGYSLPKSLTDKLQMSGIRLYVSGTNLLTFTPLKDYDPQVMTGYPLSKSYNIGINLQF